MEVIIRPTEGDAARLTAQLIATALREKPPLVLGLATGRTMETVYGLLAALHRDDGLDFSLCRTFNLDEYIGLAPEDPRSYRAYMDRHLFDEVNLDRRNTHVPNGAAADIRAECARYEKAIEDCGGIDLQLVGIGSDGHIGFNEPLSALLSRTREKALTPHTIRQNAPMFGGDESLVPRRAVTMGVGTILDGRRIILLATGADKAEVLARAVEGPVTSMITASALQLHQRCTVITDEAASARLTQVDYYRWVFENEPEWQAFQNA